MLVLQADSAWGPIHCLRGFPCCRETRSDGALWNLDDSPRCTQVLHRLRARGFLNNKRPEWRLDQNNRPPRGILHDLQGNRASPAAPRDTWVRYTSSSRRWSPPAGDSHETETLFRPARERCPRLALERGARETHFANVARPPQKCPGSTHTTWPSEWRGERFGSLPMSRADPGPPRNERHNSARSAFAEFGRLLPRRLQ